MADKQFITKVSAAENSIVSSIVAQMEKRNINLDKYSLECAGNAVSAINELLYTSGMNWSSPELDPSNYQDIIKKVALLKLNAAASNREVYFQFRSVKIGTQWKKMLEVGVEGDGNDAILRHFGVDVEKVYPYWAVREDDEFTYPEFVGMEMTPPKWKRGGTGKIVRVVYPIKLKSGEIDYRIAEREDVVRNLYAHIQQNMMNETFGIVAKRYDATNEQKAEIDRHKQELKDKIKGMTLEEMIECPEVRKYISPSWYEPHSREAMILRKMRNNAIKKFPKDFGNSYAADTYREVSDDSVKETVESMKIEANTGEIIDVDPEELKAPTTEEQPDEN